MRDFLGTFKISMFCNFIEIHRMYHWQRFYLQIIFEINIDYNHHHLEVAEGYC